MIVLILATIALILNWTLEYIRHLKNVKAIPIRIHVNGTRGKSSVTRLIAAGLRESSDIDKHPDILNLPFSSSVVAEAAMHEQAPKNYTNPKNLESGTASKTTGTLPRFILPDGREARIERLMGANIIEQKYIFRHAVGLKPLPSAIVVECMAVNPVFQWITERKLVHSTISVITNCRPDHLDQMGATVQSVTMCLSNTIPENGVCFTAEDKHFGILKDVAADRNTRIHQIRPTDVTQQELDKFNYIEHAENVQLALAVCAEVGVSREIALKGMQESQPDPGALKKYKIKDKNKTIYFFNVFAANDPDSSARVIHMVTGHLKNVEKIIIINSRSDRFYRSQQLVDAVKPLDYSYLFLTGEIPEKVEHYALHQGIPKEKIVAMGQPDTEVIYKKVWDLTDKESYVIGIGNIAGEIKYGAMIVEQFMNKMKESFDQIKTKARNKEPKSD